MKNSKVTIENEILRQIDKGNRRTSRNEAGCNDGRFMTRVVRDKSKYTRKSKHKNQ